MVRPSTSTGRASATALALCIALFVTLRAQQTPAPPAAPPAAQPPPAPAGRGAPAVTPQQPPAPDVIAKYTGRPAMIATSVITEKFVDLAKRLPPPMTADEEALSKVMKQLPPAVAALRTAVDGSKTEDANKNAAVLKQGFADI